MQTFKPHKNSRELGIDTSRKFVVVTTISSGWASGSKFPVGAVLRLYRDDNTHVPEFCREEDYKEKEVIHIFKYWYVPWKCLAYADEAETNNMTKTITGKTIAQCIRDGDIKVGDFVKVDRDVTCKWHEGVKILKIIDDQTDGTFRVVRDGHNECNCTAAQLATGLTITVTRGSIAPEARKEIKQIMNKLTSALKRALNEDLQKQYKAGFIDGGLELTGDGKAALIDLLYEEYSKKLTAKAEEVIAEAEKEE